MDRGVNTELAKRECMEVRFSLMSKEKPWINRAFSSRSASTADFKKAKGASDARMSDHIERRVIAPNVDFTRGFRLV